MRPARCTSIPRTTACALPYIATMYSCTLKQCATNIYCIRVQRFEPPVDGRHSAGAAAAGSFSIGGLSWGKDGSFVRPSAEATPAPGPTGPRQSDVVSKSLVALSLGGRLTLTRTINPPHAIVSAPQVPVILVEGVQRLGATPAVQATWRSTPSPLSLLPAPSLRCAAKGHRCGSVGRMCSPQKRIASDFLRVFATSLRC